MGFRGKIDDNIEAFPHKQAVNRLLIRDVNLVEPQRITGPAQGFQIPA
jgi:hypothetical protein